MTTSTKMHDAMDAVCLDLPDPRDLPVAMERPVALVLLVPQETVVDPIRSLVYP